MTDQKTELERLHNRTVFERKDLETNIDGDTGIEIRVYTRSSL